MNTAVTIEPGVWNTGLCHCCHDFRECCYSLWCFPCIACEATARFGQHQCLPLLDVFILGLGYGCSLCRPVTMTLRAAVRQRYGIRGSLLEDLICSSFCCCCIYCQIKREMDQRGVAMTGTSLGLSKGFRKTAQAQSPP